MIDGLVVRTRSATEFCALGVGSQEKERREQDQVDAAFLDGGPTRQHGEPADDRGDREQHDLRGAEAEDEAPQARSRRPRSPGS